MKFSVVVPVYRPPIDLLVNSIESIRSQSHSDWELIFVDDGNTDERLVSRLAEYEDGDPRIRVIAQQNQGPSAARNAGTAGATGDYVVYMDADDEMPPYALENAANALAEHDVDLLIGFVQFLRAGAARRNDRADSISLLDTSQISKLYRDTLRGRIAPYGDGDPSVRMKNGPVARFLRSEIAKKVQFPADVPVSEDTVWNLRLLDEVTTVGIMHSIWYWYRTDHASTSRGYRANSFQETLALFEVLKDDLASTRHAPRRADVTARVLGEINRAMRLHFAHPRCALSRAEKAAQVRRFLRAPGMTVTLRDACHAGMKPLIKYALFKTGIGVLLPLKFYEVTTASKSIAAPAEEDTDR